MTVSTWKVMPIPQGDKNALKTLKPGSSEEETQKVAENLGGVTIYIGQNNLQKQEFCRVGFIRRVTKNPDVSFQEEFAKQLAAADALVAEVNARLESELPAIESDLEALTTKLTEHRQQLSNEFAKLDQEVSTKVGELGDRINNLAGEIISKLSPPEGLL